MASEQQGIRRVNAYLTTQTPDQAPKWNMAVVKPGDGNATSLKCWTEGAGRVERYNGELMPAELKSLH
jgi:hypothetical protein